MSGKLSAQKVTALLTRPQNGVEPLFAAPWEAQAFATAVHLQACGVFSGQEWADCLTEEYRPLNSTVSPTSGTPIIGIGWRHSNTL